MLRTVTTAAGTFTAEVDGPAGEAGGEAPLVILLHGYPQSRHTWRAQQPALATAGWRTVAYDQRGYSPGARPDPADLANYQVDRLVEDVLAVAEASGAGDRFHLVGHDWGGAVAWLVADRHPDRVASLAVLSRPHPSAFAEAISADADGQRHRSRHHKAFHDPDTGRLLIEDGARRLRRLLADSGVPDDAVELYVSVLGDAAAMEAALAWYRAVGTISQLTAGPITVPTTYLWGTEDNSVGRTAAEGTARYVAAPYRFVEVPGGGHFLTDDHPQQMTAELLTHLDQRR